MCDDLTQYFLIISRYHRQGKTNALVRTIARQELRELSAQSGSMHLKCAIARVLSKAAAR